MAPQHYDGIGQDEVKACPYKSRRKQYKPVRSSLGNFFCAAPASEEESSSTSTDDRRNKMAECCLISKLEGSTSSVQKWRETHCDDSMEDVEISTEKDSSESDFYSPTKSEMGMEKSDSDTTLYPENLTCVQCGRCFSSARALGPHARWCGKGIQKNKCKASTLKNESPVKKDDIQGDKMLSCSSCGKVCPSIQSLGGHTKACRKNHVGETWFSYGGIQK
ncbi:hypothetical protein SUGI_0714640 [Cryptomeria japonica]|nr:hypothetical protein SUGI_0714640 [Cryptomeria japonica]